MIGRRVFTVPSESSSWREIIERAEREPKPEMPWWRRALAFLDRVWL